MTRLPIHASHQPNLDVTFNCDDVEQKSNGAFPVYDGNTSDVLVLSSTGVTIVT